MVRSRVCDRSATTPTTYPVAPPLRLWPALPEPKSTRPPMRNPAATERYVRAAPADWGTVLCALDVAGRRCLPTTSRSFRMPELGPMQLPSSIVDPLCNEGCDP